MIVQVLNIFKKPIYLISLILLTLIFLSFFLIVQIYFTPEYRAQPKLIFLVLKPKDYLLLITFAFLIAFNLIISVIKIKKVYFSVSGGVASLFSSLLAGIVATAFCSSCLSALFSFLGTTSALGLTFFFLKYKTWIILGNFLFLGLLTFYNLKSLSKDEKECNC